MKHTLTKNERYTLFTINEKNFTSATASDLKTEFVLLSTEGVKNIILDLSMVEFMDSSGLGAILTGRRLFEDHGGSFTIVNVHEAVYLLLKISKLENILNLFRTESEALDFITMEELERDLNGEQ
jgi:anti-anti-sigma factor